MTLSPFQFPLYSVTDKSRSVLIFGQNGVYPGERAGGESGLHILRPKFFASHAIISHMRY